MFSFLTKPASIPSADDALPGRGTPMFDADIGPRHAVLGNPLTPPFPAGHKSVLLGMGCFWGAERIFWQQGGVWVTSVGYAGGHTPNPTYEEVCSGRTGHAEVVQVVFDPAATDLAAILAVFWESHDPTQGMRQGNDRGTQYRSAIYVEDEADNAAAGASRDAYAAALKAAGGDAITTEIAAGKPYYLAEEYHQQYLHKNPGGYCGIGGCGVKFPAL